ncbi:MAG: hypothetical protein CL398_12755 [Acidiferrobacteraceae bacterium]|nr:hypothetical protein [Acidiferrobacteraceae bacterium]
MSKLIEPTPAGLMRRISALLYDMLLVTAATFIAFLPAPLIGSFIDESIWGTSLTSLYLLGVWFFFLGWFWTHGGQTLGMKAWRIKVIHVHALRVRWGTAAARFGISNAGFLLLLMLVSQGLLTGQLAAILGFAIFLFAFLWILVDNQHCALHDRLSSTRIVKLPSTNK